jgi:hypothetical protein
MAGPDYDPVARESEIARRRIVVMRFQTKYPNVVTWGGLELEPAAFRTFRVGNVINLNGELVRITKKTNFAVAVEPFTLWDRLEGWVIEKLGGLLP